MQFLLVMLVIVAVWDVAKSAVRHTAADYQRSRQSAVRQAEKAVAPASLPKAKRSAAVRRHATGYWAREALHLFPVTRTGWHAGWLAHKTARVHGRAIREEARTTHAETQASFIQGLRDHRQRQREAQEAIDKVIAEAEQPPRGRKEAEEVAGKVVRFPARKPGDAPPLPSDGVAKPEPGPYAKTSRPGSKPGDAPRGEEATSSPAANGTAPSTATEGMPMSDTTYTSVLADAKAAHAQADEDTTTIRKRMDDAYAAADAMTAQNVDPAVIDAQMAYAESLKQALDALTQAGEHAGSTATTAERFHGQMQEAVDSSPGRVAERQFHES